MAEDAVDSALHQLMIFLQCDVNAELPAELPQTQDPHCHPRDCEHQAEVAHPILSRKNQHASPVAVGEEKPQPDAHHNNSWQHQPLGTCRVRPLLKPEENCMDVSAARAESNGMEIINPARAG